MDISYHTETAPVFGRNTGLSKVVRYGWVIKDRPGVLQFIDKRQLKVDHRYQRDGVRSKIHKIASTWSWIACGVIIVGQREGNYWVIDGQHRVLAAMLRSDIAELPCIVFETDGVEQEATGFLDANTMRKPVNSIDKFRAANVAGDKSAIEIQRLIDENNLKISNQGNRHGELKCISLVGVLYERDKDALSVALKLAAELCDAEKIPVGKTLLAALWYIHRNINVNDGLLDKRLRSRLIDIGAKKLQKAAHDAAIYYSTRGEKVWAKGIIDAANKKLHNKFHFRSEVDAD